MPYAICHVPCREALWAWSCSPHRSGTPRAPLRKMHAISPGCKRGETHGTCPRIVRRSVFSMSPRDATLATYASACQHRQTYTCDDEPKPLVSLGHISSRKSTHSPKKGSAPPVTMSKPAKWTIAAIRYSFELTTTCCRTHSTPCLLVNGITRASRGSRPG